MYILEREARNLRRDWSKNKSRIQKKVSNKLLQEIDANLNDLYYSSQIMRDIDNDLKSLLLEDKNFSHIHELNKLSIVIKMLYISTRALQDNWYRLLQELKGDKPGVNGMQQCYNNKNNVIHRAIIQHIPNYFEWFSQMRSVRNSIKEGIISGGGSWLIDKNGIEDINVMFSFWGRHKHPLSRIIGTNELLDLFSTCMSFSKSLVKIEKTIKTGGK